jgi:uncharacterized protein YyaL (SSP411 family)
MSLLDALDDFLTPPQIVIIRASAPDGERWAAALRATYAPSRMIFAIPSDAPGLPPALAEKRAAAVPVAYLCTGTTCSAPMRDLAEIAAQLNTPRND